MSVLSRPVALITGGSSGIGLELAKQFAYHGYDLILVARDMRKLLDAEALLLRDNPATDIRIISEDLTLPDGADRVYAGAMQTGWRVDVLVNNAGQGVYGDFTTQTDLQAEMEMIQLNIVSVVRLTKLFARDMVARGHGKILMTASMVALAGAPYLTVYAATKAFIYSFAEGLRDEVKDKGVVVTALLPGATDTNFFRRAKMQNTRVANSNLADPADVARAGFNALMNDSDHVVAPSFKTKVGAAITKFMPAETATKLSRVQ